MQPAQLPPPCANAIIIIIIITTIIISIKFVVVSVATMHHSVLQT